MIHALGCQDCQSGVPLVRMTSPNPIKVVLLPKAAQVHCFFPYSNIPFYNLLSDICEGFSTYPICDNCYPKRILALYPPEAHNNRMQCSHCCNVWPPPSLLERMLFGHLWKKKKKKLQVKLLSTRFWTAEKNKNEFANIIHCTVKPAENQITNISSINCIHAKNSDVYFTHGKQNKASFFLGNSIVTVPSPNSTYGQSFTRANKH